MVARLKREGIDERGPSGVASVALFDATREKTRPVQGIVRTDRLIALS